MKNLCKVTLIALLLSTVTGCKKDQTPQPTAQTITISSDKTYILADGKDVCTLTVKDNSGKEVTSQCQFTANGSSINGGSFSTAIVGKYKIKAKYNDTESNEIEVEARTSVPFMPKIVVEDYTGTWCGYCPRVAYKIDDAKGKNKNVLAIAIHIQDALATEYASALSKKFGITGLPTAIVNRSTQWDENYNSLLPYTQIGVPVGIAIESIVNSGNATAKITLKFKDASMTNLKVAAYLTEDNVVENQTNYYDDGKGSPIVGFKHMNVLREKMSKELFGDLVTPSSIIPEGTYTTNLSIPLRNEWISANCKVLVLVTNGSNDRVVNAQEVVLGQNISY
jgi:Thioredoxin./Outer membrane protein Omp28.